MAYPQPPINKLKTLPLPTIEEILLGSRVKGKILLCDKQPFSRIDFIFAAGSRYQSQRFVAQMTNAMLKEGTPAFTSAQIAEHFDFYGSYLQTFSDRDEAGLILYSLNKHLEPALEMVLHLLSHASFPSQEFEVNKMNKIRAMEVDHERVESIARKTYFRKLFGSQHPYGEMGEIEELAKLEPAVLSDYKRSFYGYDNLRVLVTTSEQSQVFSLMEKIIPTLEITDEPIALQPFPKVIREIGGQIIIKKEGALQAAIRMGIPLFNRTHPDFHDLSILVTILGGYFGSRLMKNLREEKGYTYGIGSGIISLKDHGYLTISTTVGGDVWQDSIDQILVEMKKLTQEKVSEQELKLVQNYLTGDLQRKLDGPYALADTFRSLWLNNLNFNHITEILNHINKITPDRLKQIAQNYLQPSNFITVVCTP